MRRVHRTQLQNAPYNPRKIDKRAREKLRKNLKDVGLVEPPTWNESTGNILSGHQRVAALDSLEGQQDYLLDVSVVQMELAKERQQNVFMNNPSTQGDYDLTMLAALLKQDDFEPASAGFDKLDLEVVFSDDELGQMFKLDAAAQAVMADIASVGGVKAERVAAAGPENEAGEGAEDDGDAGEGGEQSGDEPAAAAEPAQRRSDAVKEFMAAKDDKHDTETYAVVVFTTRREREIFMATCQYDKDQRYIDGARVFSRLGIDPNDAQWATAFDEQPVHA